MLRKRNGSPPAGYVGSPLRSSKRVWIRRPWPIWVSYVSKPPITAILGRKVNNDEIRIMERTPSGAKY